MQYFCYFMFYVIIEILYINDIIRGKSNNPLFYLILGQFFQKLI
jgi:hypothetical protein